MDAEPAVEQVPDNELVTGFESIGDNCELGLVQRRAGSEPLGLLRFAGAPLRNVVRALRARFADIGAPHHIRINVENGEYIVKLTKYDFTYHAYVDINQVTPEALHRQQCRTVAFLAEKLIGDLEAGTKTLVFRQNEPLLAGDLVDLRLALSAYGPNRILWVQEARPCHSPGTVQRVDDGLIVGHVRRLADRDDVHALDFESWMTVLRRAHALVRDTVAPVTEYRPSRTDIVFGAEGNAQPFQGFGWSGAEAGYTWSVGERSLLTIDSPGEADEYWLEMDLSPYICPPLLPRQRLDVVINGTLVHSFDPLPRGEVGCTVPGHLVRGKGTVEILLDHPFAASPILVAGGRDDRRLGVAMSRLSLICA